MEVVCNYLTEMICYEISLLAKEGLAVFEGLFQPMHLLVILAIVLIIKGPGKLSEVGSSLGKVIRGFKKSLEDEPPDGEGIHTMHIEGKEDKAESSPH
jgi:sec-independent protein translocase protein TatA